jgi:cell division protein FtsB
MKISLRRAVYSILVLGGIAYGFVSLQGPNGIPALIERRREIRRYEQENAELRRRMAERQERIQRLEKDPGEQEKEIRQRYKLAPPDEKIYILDGPLNQAKPDKK